VVLHCCCDDKGGRNQLIEIVKFVLGWVMSGEDEDLSDLNLVLSPLFGRTLSDLCDRD
jgi:hypothetical protein